MSGEAATHVVDANVVLAWTLDRPYSASALALRNASANRLTAPDLLIHEVGNALGYYVRNEVLSLDQAERAYAHIPVFMDLVPGEHLKHAALRLAVETGHSIYDCFYLALARSANVALVTADDRLATVAKRVAIPVVLLDGPNTRRKLP